jgi:hypothetical protein
MSCETIEPYTSMSWPKITQHGDVRLAVDQYQGR